VKQQVTFPTTLGIARKFQITEAKIGMTSNGDLRSWISVPGFRVKRFNGRAVTFHDKPVCRGNVVKRTIKLDFEDESVIQASGALQYGAAARAAAVNGNAACFASRDIDFGANLVGITNDDKKFLRFPKAQNFFAGARFTPIEQCLVAREIFGGRSECQVE